MADEFAPRGHVLITGASSGIGRACAMQLCREGFGVFAGVRNETDARSVERDALTRGGCLHSVMLDVTCPASISAAFEKISTVVGTKGLAGVVNNAGVSVVGPVEHVPLDEWRRQFEINLFGVIAVTQSALPMLRDHVAYAGRWVPRLVNMGSIAGRVAQPVLGPYTASKFALESLSDSLRLELLAQGIHVCLVEPGAVDTCIWQKAKSSATTMREGHPARRLYGALLDGVSAGAARAHAHSSSPQAVAQAVTDCLTRKKPKTRSFVGLDAKSGAMAKRLMPDRLFDVMLGAYYAVPR